MQHNNLHDPRYMSGFHGRVYGGHVGPMRGHAYGSEKPPKMPWATRDNDPTPGTSGAAAAPGTADDSDDDDNNEGDNQMSDVVKLEDTIYRVYRDQGHPHDEAVKRAACYVGMPPRNMRGAGWDTPADGTPEGVEYAMFKGLRNQGYSAEDAARRARAFVSR